MIQHMTITRDFYKKCLAAQDAVMTDDSARRWLLGDFWAA